MCAIPIISCSYACHKATSPMNLVVVVVATILQLHPNEMQNVFSQDQQPS